MILYTHTHTHTLKMKYYSAIKNEILPFVTTCIKFQDIILKEMSQTEKDKYCKISPICAMQK